MKKSCYLSTLLLVMLALANGSTLLAGKQSNSSEKAPNIVLLFVDDLGWTDLGFRNPIVKSPNIDQLARDGVSFEQAYIASPTCSPSRATLVTGQHPARLKLVRHLVDDDKAAELIRDETGFITHTIWRKDPSKFPSINYLGLEYTTYAEALNELGYYNLFIGKWHLGDKRFHPIHQGFDHQIGTTDHGSPSSYYPDYFKKSDVLEEETELYLTDKLTDEAVQFIEDYEKDQPFMLSFFYYNVHTPHIGRKDLVEYYKSLGLEDRRLQFRAMTSAVDESVGRIRDALKARGIDKETIIILTSDQGSWFENPPYRGGKRIDTLCEGGARVPFLVNWPGVTKPNSTNDSVIQTTDLFPTFVELAGGDPNKHENLDGVSLISTIKNNSELKRKKPVYGYRAYEDMYVSVREGPWKLIAYRSGKICLYNVVKDRYEQNDLVKKLPEKVASLKAKLIKWEKEMDVAEYSGVQ